MRLIRKIEASSIKPFDVNLLLTLAVLLQTQSVSRAARRLGISQPTVSRSLNQLRTMLGDRLLVRSGGTMALTPRGAQLAQPLEAWMAMTSTVLQAHEFEPSTLEGSFQVAATDFGILSVVSPILPAITAAAPGCRLEVSGYTDDMFKKLASGELDIIIYGFKPDEAVCHARHLFRETQSIIVRPDHPLLQAGTGVVTLENYFDWPHLAVVVGANRYDHVQESLGAQAARRRVLARIPYFYAAPDLIGASDAILTMPTRAATKFARSHGFALMPAPVEIAEFDYWVLWHDRSARDPATLWLIDMLSDAAAVASEAA